jgi:hypothetical protein
MYEEGKELPPTTGAPLAWLAAAGGPSEFFHDVFKSESHDGRAWTETSKARQTHTGKKVMKEKNTKKSWAKKEGGRIGNEKKNNR